MSAQPVVSGGALRCVDCHQDGSDGLFQNADLFACMEESSNNTSAGRLSWRPHATAQARRSCPWASPCRGLERRYKVAHKPKNLEPQRKVAAPMGAGRLLTGMQDGAPLRSAGETVLSRAVRHVCGDKRRSTRRATRPHYASTGEGGPRRDKHEGSPRAEGLGLKLHMQVRSFSFLGACSGVAVEAVISPRRKWSRLWQGDVSVRARLKNGAVQAV